MLVLGDNEHKTKIVKMVIDILNKGNKADINFNIVISEPEKVVISYDLFITSTELLGQPLIVKRKTMTTDIGYRTIAMYVFDYSIENIGALPVDRDGTPVMDLNNITPEQEIKLGKLIMQHIWNDIKGGY